MKDLHEKKISEIFNEQYEKLSKELAEHIANGRDGNASEWRMMIAQNTFMADFSKRWAIAVVKERMESCEFEWVGIHKETGEMCVTNYPENGYKKVPADDVCKFLINRFEITEEDLKYDTESRRPYRGQEDLK